MADVAIVSHGMAHGAAKKIYGVADVAIISHATPHATAKKIHEVGDVISFSRDATQDAIPSIAMLSDKQSVLGGLFNSGTLDNIT